MDHYLFGRDVAVADIITAHPSCSKQHAVLQFRVTEKEDEYGLRASAVRPYLLDLGSVNGSFLNGEELCMISIIISKLSALLHISSAQDGVRPYLLDLGSVNGLLLNGECYVGLPPPLLKNNKYSLC